MNGQQNLILRHINNIENHLFNLFKKLSHSLDVTLRDKANLPMFVDYLMRKGIIDREARHILLNLFAVHDSLRFQVLNGESIGGRDFKLLLELNSSVLDSLLIRRE